MSLKMWHLNCFERQGGLDVLRSDREGSLEEGIAHTWQNEMSREHQLGIDLVWSTRRYMRNKLEKWTDLDERGSEMPG